MRWLLAVAVLSGCGDSHEAASIDAAPEIDAAIDAAGLTWETVNQTKNDGAVIVEDVTYRSEGLKIHAHLCRPADTARHGALIYNHGGFQGLALDAESQRCEATAQLGYVWLGSSYRGEDGSEGRVEVCLGEVTDVLEMQKVAAAQPYIDPAKFVMYGGSHGGCITQRAVQRGAPLLAAADLFGPTDWAPLYAFWQSKGNTSLYPQLIQVMTMATGGTPTAKPAEYAMRSPINFPYPTTVPLFIAHGAIDDIVPVVQSCHLGMTLSFPSWHLDATPIEVATTPAGCEGTGVPTLTTARPRPGWSGSKFLVIYDGLGHETSSAAAQTMLQDVATFMMAKLR